MGRLNAQAAIAIAGDMLRPAAHSPPRLAGVVSRGQLHFTHGLLQLVDKTGVLDGHRQLVGHDLQHGDFVLVEPTHLLTLEADGADDVASAVPPPLPGPLTTPSPQGQHHLRAHLPRQGVINVDRILSDVLNHIGAPGGRHPAYGAFLAHS